MDGVAGAADFRGLDGLAVLRNDAQRMLHGRLLGVLERAINRVRRADEETAGEGAAEAGVVGVQQLLAFGHAAVLRLFLELRGVCLAEHHVMAGIAGDAVARQATEMRQGCLLVVGREGHGVDHVAREVRAGGAGLGGVDTELPLALDAVAAEADGLHQRRLRRVEGLGLAGELGEEDRITAGQAHGAGAPGAVRGEIDQRRLFRRDRSGDRRGHLVLQPGAAGAVAAHALVGGDESVGLGRLAAGVPHIVISLRLHVQVGLVRRRQAGQIQCRHKSGVGRRQC